MTVQELLKPRYKVIADYPSHWLHPHIGIIQTGETGSTEDGFVFEYKNYPHLFKKLEWWEDRKPVEMPEYVKINTLVTRVPYKVVKVGWFDGDYFGDEKKKMSANSIFLPATEAEYLTYKQQSK